MDRRTLTAINQTFTFRKGVRLTLYEPYRLCLRCGSTDHDYTKCMYECMHCHDEQH